MTFDEFDDDLEDLLEEDLDDGTPVEQVVARTLVVLADRLVSEVGLVRAEKLFMSYANQVLVGMWVPGRREEGVH